MELNYQDIATFVKVTSSGGYRGSKTMVEQDTVPVIFVQATGFVNAGYQENVDADAICWCDPTNDFVVNNFNRLEGVYILAPLYGVDDADAWYKVESVVVNRDHLLNNEIDNIELRLKKSEAPAGVS